MTVLPALCFSLVADGQTKFLQQFLICPEWLDALALLLLSVGKYTVGIGIGMNIPEKCLAGLLCIKGKKRICVFTKE